jgi:hypothetical protein
LTDATTRGKVTIESNDVNNELAVDNERLRDEVKKLNVGVFFSAEGPQDKDTIDKVILKNFFFSVEGPQDEDLIWKREWQVPKLPPASA